MDEALQPMDTSWIGGEGLPSAVGEEPLLPDQLALQIYPNPVNSRVILQYTVAVPAPIALSLWDPRGRHWQHMVFGRNSPGTHEAQLDLAPYPSGMYVVRLQSPRQAVTRKIILLE